MRNIKNKKINSEEINNLMAKHDFLKAGTKRILLIDDDIYVHELFKQFMKDYNKKVILQIHDDEDMATSAFKFDLPDIVIIDYNLKNTSGLDLSKIFNDITFLKIPTVFISGDNNVVEQLFEQYQESALYIPKPLNKYRVFECLDYCLATKL